ncbi:MAG: hypothetical protein JW771_01615, partial [Candidatus Thermoplasmatota archaeon]|nr:hypothetical protein [Candidatus Thermoplasmatota archaeon]
MHIYLGTFLIALSTLALEITLTRLLSVVAWYHLAFFAIATAMLGMTAGATTVYLKPNWFSQKLNDNIAKACLGYALVTPLSLIILCMTPLVLRPSIMALCAILIVTIACSLPFYFSGIVITVALTKYQLPIGKIYASDLIGAAIGCLLVLIGLELFDAPSLILLLASIGILAGLSFAWKSPSFKLRRLGSWLFVILVISAFINSSTVYGIGPYVIKGQVTNPSTYLLEKWNSFSRVVLYKGLTHSPQIYGASPVAPKEGIFQHYMNIDGAAGTTLRRFYSIDDIDHLRFDVTNVAYYLRQQGGACIIGVGGAKDLQSAILFGHEKVIGIDVNPVFIDLLQNEFREFAGLADRKGVTFIVDEARSYLARIQDKYSIIQMSLIDTWASTGAGAFSLSENALYTIEAWQIFLNRLAEDGIFTVSRWYNSQNIGETGRIVSLAVATLLQSGIKNPSQHIAMITIDKVSTLLVSKQPFSAQDIATLKKVSADLEYDIAILPSMPPSHEILRDIVSVNSLEELNSAIADEILNYKPPTDENPYFFNMLRLKHISPAFLGDNQLIRSEGVMGGNLRATCTLGGLILSLLLLTILTNIIPLIVRSRQKENAIKVGHIFWSRALYFSLIGAGFMFVEIALIQRLSVFLGHPVYALGILLFTIIACTGVGSFISERLPLTRSPWIFVSPFIMVSAILITHFLLPVLMSRMITSAMLNKIVVSILMICPMGTVIGFFFPTGMRLVNAVGDPATPWYWALNGITGVLVSALAVFFSIYFGISTNFYIA